MSRTKRRQKGYRPWQTNDYKCYYINVLGYTEKEYQREQVLFWESDRETWYSKRDLKEHSHSVARSKNKNDLSNFLKQTDYSESNLFDRNIESCSHTWYWL